MASIFGAAKRGFGKALRAHRIKHGKRGKTITGVKPMSGKIPSYVGIGGKDAGKRRNMVKTHFSLKRSDKINKLEKQVKEGKEGLKNMEATGQAKELKDYKGKGTGIYQKKGFAKGGHVNTSRENRLEELGRVDAEKAYSSKGKRNLKDEKKRIVKELS